MIGAALKRRPHLIPCLCAISLLAGNLATGGSSSEQLSLTFSHKLSYGKYSGLRGYEFPMVGCWGVCAAATFIAFKSYRWKALWGAWAFGIVALFFNPFVPTVLPKDTWPLVDLATAVAFVVAAFVLRAPQLRRAESEEDRE